MYGSTILVTLLGASSTVFAAPAWPQLKSELANTVGLDAVSDYFNLVAQKVDAAKLLSFVPACDISKAQLPTRKHSHLTRNHHT